MRAALFRAPRRVEAGDRPDPVLRDPGDAVVRVVVACVCGSDLWPYRGVHEYAADSPIGHEFVGVVQDIGAEVATLSRGDLVIAPFVFADGTCPHCRFGFPTSCLHGGFWGRGGHDGGQGEAVRVPFADATVLRVPVAAQDVDDALLASLLALSDVMGTGHHAAVSAGVRSGGTAVVVGDGAVGLCGVLAANRLGARRIIAMSRYPDRQQLARTFGATDVVAERGEAGAERVMELTGGVGADAVLECVGTAESFATAFDVARPGGGVGFVGVPHGAKAPVGRMFGANIGLRGGVAPVRVTMPELLDDVLQRRIEPGLVFDLTTDLEGIGEAYAAMDERRAIKSLVRVGPLA